MYFANLHNLYKKQNDFKFFLLFIFLEIIIIPFFSDKLNAKRLQSKF